MYNILCQKRIININNILNMDLKVFNILFIVVKKRGNKDE